MLSRAKKGMFIVSSKAFLMGVGSETLVGWFAQKIMDSSEKTLDKGKACITVEDIQKEDFLKVQA